MVKKRKKKSDWEKAVGSLEWFNKKKKLFVSIQKEPGSKSVSLLLMNIKRKSQRESFFNSIKSARKRADLYMKNN